MIPGFANRRKFRDLSEQDARIYRSYAEMLRADYPASAAIFDGMAI